MYVKCETSGILIITSIKYFILIHYTVYEKILYKNIINYKIFNQTLVILNIKLDILQTRFYLR